MRRTELSGRQKLRWREVDGIENILKVEWPGLGGSVLSVGSWAEDGAAS